MKNHVYVQLRVHIHLYSLQVVEYLVPCLGKKHNDTDIFLHNCSEESAINVIKQLHIAVANISPGFSTRVTRTANVVSITTNYEWKYGFEYQIILRLYRSPSEILHGFDVDCCCVGYDGKDLWITDRALFSIINGYNTVNFDRLSPSYEFRLAKYGTRGMSIKIPGFDRKKVNDDELLRLYIEHKGKSSYQHISYAHLTNLKYLDILLYLEFKYKESSGRIFKSLNLFDKEHSDYNIIPYNRTVSGDTIFELFLHMSDTAGSYPDISQKYMPYIDRFVKRFYKNDKRFYENDGLEHKSYEVFFNIDYPTIFTNAVFYPNVKSIDFVKTDVRNLDEILNIDDDIYKCLGVIKPWSVPQKITFKTQNPGEQMTNTIHKVVLKDNSAWFKCYLYGNNKPSYDIKEICETCLGLIDKMHKHRCKSEKRKSIILEIDFMINHLRTKFNNEYTTNQLLDLLKIYTDIRKK